MGLSMARPMTPASPVDTARDDTTKKGNSEGMSTRAHRSSPWHTLSDVSRE